MSEILVGRQPIFDRQLDVHAYELLFRGEGLDPEDPSNGDMATSRVILNAFTEIGLDDLTSNKRAFLNLTRSFIIGELALPITPAQVVLEVLESVQPDAEVLLGLARLRKAGFTIALDDFVLTKATRAFMPFADLIKLDVLGLSNAKIEAQVEELRPFEIPLLAEKVETQEQFEACKAMGFRYFQGFFLERPSVVSGRVLHPQQLTMLALLQELHSPAFNFARAEEIVRQDVGLCYRLLRHINSALYGMPREIKSVRETLVYMGVESVQNLTSLFLMASESNTPSELIASAMIRARMCENLGREKGDKDYRMYFIVGLFSCLDAIMKVPMAELLRKLPLSAEQKLAIEHGSGDMGQALSSVRAYEHGNWDQVACFGISSKRLQELYLDALKWAKIVGDDDKKPAAA